MGVIYAVGTTEAENGIPPLKGKLGVFLLYDPGPPIAQLLPPRGGFQWILQLLCSRASSRISWARVGLKMPQEQNRER